MAIRGLYVADGTTTYTTADTKLLNSKIANGKVIWGSTNLRVTAQPSSSMSVNVAAGVCSSSGMFLQNTVSHRLNIESNTGDYPRIDTIVAYISGNNFDLRVLKGVPSASPLPQSTSSTIYVKLAEVYVGTGVTSIQSSNITDCRATTNGQAVIVSLASSIVHLENRINGLDEYRYTSSSGEADRGVRKQADGFCRCWNSGIANVTGNNLDVTALLSNTFVNPKSCSVTARFLASDGTPINVACEMKSGHQVRLYYPTSAIPKIANGEGSWFVCVEGY